MNGSASASLILMALLGLLHPSVATGQLVAPNREGKAVNQLAVSGNACGPAALLTSYTLASPRWQEIPRGLPGKDDRARLDYVIKQYGGRPSKHLNGRPRWNHKNGISLVDLTDVANEMRNGRRLPELEWEVLLPRERESELGLFKRTHSRLSKSLQRGLPPIIGLQRLAHRKSGDQKTWATVYGHFIVITELPRKLERNAHTFPVRYADPWGGAVRTGQLRIVKYPGLSAVVAELPESQVGRRLLRKGEQSVVIVSSGLGDF